MAARPTHTTLRDAAAWLAAAWVGAAVTGATANAGAPSAGAETIAIIAGAPSHGHGEHEHHAGALLIRAALEAAQPHFTVDVHRGWPADPAELADAAAIVLTMDGDRRHAALDHLDELDALMQRGVGLLALHWAVHVPRGAASAAFQRWLGGSYESGFSTNPKWRARLRLDPAHPIARGVPDTAIFDEWYFNIRFAEGLPVVPIATAVPSDDDRARVSAFWPWARPPRAVREASERSETLVWAIERSDGGRGVGFTGGHFHWNFGNDAFRRLLLNAVVWVAGGDVPPGGVHSDTPTMPELRANQDEREPRRFDEAAVRERFGLRLPEPAPAETAAALPIEAFAAPDDLEVRVWAESPQLYNPTSIDVDAAGRLWVAESWNYRGWPGEREDGDRIVVLEDTNGDGRADSSHVFVQEPALAAPLGVAVIGNRVIVSMAPDLIQYTDVDGDLRFDPAVDERTHLLSGFGGADSDHGLHGLVVGPDGLWYGNHGDDGGAIRDRDGRLFVFKGRTSGSRPAAAASDDGHRYVGGAAWRMQPDGSGFEVIGHNFRNAYEVALTSFGDVLQADNDDGPASRVTWLMEYANAGYRSPDGTRSWFFDRRPGEPVASAHWRQRDPGVLPAGDVYGDGAPAGLVFNEGDGLGPRYRDTLITAEAALETLLGHHLRPQGAGFALQRFDLVTANPARRLSGTDQSRGAPMTGIAGWFARRAGESRARDRGPAWFERAFRVLGIDRAYTAPEDAGPLRFRPSDVAIGTDGALYVADWLDAFIGGNTMSDLERRGAIYRIAPRNAATRAPTHEVETLGGAVRALRSPAVHVRALGFEALRMRGSSARAAVETLLDDDDANVRARAVWLLPHLGPEGVARARALLAHRDPRMRVLAFRALRRANTGAIADAAVLARDPHPAPRREAALAMRDVAWSEAGPVLLALARRLEPDDAWAVEALGIGATGKEAALFEALRAAQPGFPEPWSPASERITWRLHPPAAIDALRARALDAKAPTASRRLAADALAFIDDARAPAALQAVTALPDPELARHAAWWLERNADVRWDAFDTHHALARQYDPQLFIDFRALADARDDAREALPPDDVILALPADPVRGAELFRSGRAPCAACHAIEGEGGAIGPDLGALGARLQRDGIVARLVRPSSSVMPDARALGLSAQDVADLSAHLASRR